MANPSRFELCPWLGHAMPCRKLFLDEERKGEAANDGTRRRKATNERLTRQRLKWIAGDFVRVL